MIAYIEGNVLEKSFNTVTLLTNGGVGYEIHIHEGTYSQLPGSGICSLYVYDHITENARSLFGFLEAEEKQVFKELLKISGVGGKVALQILSLGIQNLLQAITQQDNKSIESVKGIGKKMAEKILLELKDKDFGITLSAEPSSRVSLPQGLSESIQSTLVGMGYTPQDVARCLSQLPPDMTDAADILPYVIQELS
ncbi:Holliday junction branch migration protein RuvA [Candidatus Gracilibacteria bacterium]|nr:Holliday junction branch migration protein RuvA [Candidatus Gracilibacteria bacterium]